MRGSRTSLPRLTSAVALVAVACSTDATPSGPPTGLAVRLTIGPSSASSTPVTASLAAAGDSIVATAISTTTGCSDYSADAGVSGTTLVVTITSRANGMACTQDIRYARYVAVVRPAPRGTYAAALRFRYEDRAGRVVTADQTVASDVVTLP